MTFKNCIENFPLNDTLVGHYDTDQSFSVPANCNIDDIEEWHDNPFWEDSSCYSFITFDPTIKKFTCWRFLFARVKGYINETYDNEGFYPATYTEDFGWEKIDPFNEYNNRIVLPDDELAYEIGWPWDKMNEPQWQREHVAYLFNAYSYMKGFTFTTPNAVKNFVKERKDLL